ncbi:MAG: chorismate-binding protein [Flavobacteriales bacterium]|nr:chorismate-binding protein [Flavobacteriales bacterium]
MNNGLQAALANYLERGLTFACFRMPGKPIELWVQRTPELDSVDRALLYELNEVFLLAPFELDQARIQFIRADKDLVIVDPQADCDLFPEFEGIRTKDPEPMVDIDQRNFEYAVSNALDAIDKGVLEKVVLSRTVTTSLEAESVPALFLTSLDRYSQAFVALIHTPDHGTWLGASPERFMSALEDTVRVDAMAATRRADDAPNNPDEWSAKERHEQALVTKSILSTMIDLGLRETHTFGPEVIGAGNLAHLRTTIQADLGGRSLADLVLALHPTAAVCGTPRKAALEHLLSIEQHKRQLYSGFWGPWSADGETELFVNLRCLKVNNGSATLYTGAGIVKNSDPRTEWEETANKAQTWLKLLEALPRPVSSHADAD